MLQDQFLNTKFEKYDLARVWAIELQNLLISNKAKDHKIILLNNKIKALEAQIANEAKAPFVKIYG